MDVRTVTVEGDGDTSTWTLTIRTGFSARMLEDLGSGDLFRILRAADQLVVDHNMPNVEGEVAPSLMDVYPAQAAQAMVMRALDAMSKVPNG